MVSMLPGAVAGVASSISKPVEAKVPIVAKELSAIEIKRLEHRGTGGKTIVAVGGVQGLLIQVRSSGAKSWLLRYRLHGRRVDLGLGSYPTMTLAAAREEARRIHALIRDGVDPKAEREREQIERAKASRKGLTFAEAVERYLEKKLPELSNGKHRNQWTSTLATYALPALGDKAVNEIEMKDLLGVLEPIWRTKHETASRLRGRIEEVLSWATVQGHRTGDNPARWKGNLSVVLSSPTASSRNGGHQPAVALGEIADWYSDVRSREGCGALALRFLALTAARSGEVRGMVWDEVDLENLIWVVPASRTKTNKEHRVPLSTEAAEFLNGLPHFHGTELVFPSPTGKEMSDATISKAMKAVHAKREMAMGEGYLDQRTKRPAVPHGLRSSFRDWAAEHTSHPSEMAEIALGHSVGSKVEQAYRRADMLEKRRKMMEEWAGFLMNGA